MIITNHGAKVCSPLVARGTVGTPINVPPWRFTVAAAKLVPTVQTIFGGSEQAQGIFLVLHLVAENTGKSPGTLSAHMFTVIDDAGAESAPATGVTGIVNETNVFLFHTVNPGVSVTGDLVFDMPKSTTLAALKLRASNAGGGGSTFGEVALQP